MGWPWEQYFYSYSQWSHIQPSIYWTIWSSSQERKVTLMYALTTSERKTRNLSFSFWFSLNSAQQLFTHLSVKFYIFVSFDSWIAWQFVGHLMNVFGIVDLPLANKDTGKIDESTSVAWKWRSISMGALFFLVLPFNLSKNLATLRYFSMFILCIVFFTISVSLI